MYKEEGGKRYQDPHIGRLDSINKAERVLTRTQEEKDVMNFIYAKEDALKTLDPDKVR